MPGPGEPGHETWENGSWEWTGNTGVWTEITVDPEAGPRLPARRDADHRRVRRQPPRRQPLRRKPRRGRSEDRCAEVALPVRASPAVGSRHVVGAAADGRDDRRQAAQGRRGAVQTELALRASIASPASPIWPIEERPVPQARHAAREDGEDAAVRDQAAGVRAHARQRERPHRLHAGAAQAGAREPQAVPLGADAVRAARGSELEAARRDQHRQHQRRHQLAGRGLRSGDRHLLLAGRQLGRHGGEVRPGRVRPREP